MSVRRWNSCRWSVDGHDLDTRVCVCPSSEFCNEEVQDEPTYCLSCTQYFSGEEDMYVDNDTQIMEI
jgi:hypothetical protein